MLSNNKNNRRELIFNLITEQYLTNGLPVSSKFVSAEPSIQASSATVRNEMCQLEQLGLIYSPHTSAGRIPTELGLRRFVDNILQTKQAQSSMLQKLSVSLGQATNPDEICENAAKLISDMTHLTGFVVMPKTHNEVIRQLELVRLADRRLLCVLIDEHDHIQNRVVELTNPVSEQTLQQTLQLLNMALSGFSMTEGAERLPYFIKQSSPEVYELVKLALFGDKVVANEQLFFCSGETRLINPEISTDTNTLKNLVRSFEDLTQLMPLFNHCQDIEQVYAFIGEEIGLELLRTCSLVVKPFSKQNQVTGYLAVIGPKRMDYQSIIPAVDIAANILSSALNREFQSP